MGQHPFRNVPVSQKRASCQGIEGLRLRKQEGNCFESRSTLDTKCDDTPPPLCSGPSIYPSEHQCGGASHASPRQPLQLVFHPRFTKRRQDSENLGAAQSTHHSQLAWSLWKCLLTRAPGGCEAHLHLRKCWGRKDATPLLPQGAAGDLEQGGHRPPQGGTMMEAEGVLTKNPHNRVRSQKTVTS